MIYYLLTIIIVLGLGNHEKIPAFLMIVSTVHNITLRHIMQPSSTRTESH